MINLKKTISMQRHLINSNNSYLTLFFLFFTLIHSLYRINEQEASYSNQKCPQPNLKLPDIIKLKKLKKLTKEYQASPPLYEWNNKAICFGMCIAFMKTPYTFLTQFKALETENPTTPNQLKEKILTYQSNQKRMLANDVLPFRKIIDQFACEYELNSLAIGQSVMMIVSGDLADDQINPNHAISILKFHENLFLFFDPAHLELTAVTTKENINFIINYYYKDNLLGLFSFQKLNDHTRLPNQIDTIEGLWKSAIFQLSDELEHLLKNKNHTIDINRGVFYNKKIQNRALFLTDLLNALKSKYNLKQQSIINTLVKTTRN